MSRVRFNTNDSTYVDDTYYAINSNAQLDHELLQQIYGDINPYLDENSGEEVEVGSGEDELEDTPTSPVTKVPNETTNSTEQNSGRPPLIPPTREKVKYQRPKTSVVWQFMTLDKENSIVICNKYKQPFKRKQGGGQGGTGDLNRPLLPCVPIQYKEAKLLADKKKGIPVNDFDINIQKIEKFRAAIEGNTQREVGQTSNPQSKPRISESQEFLASLPTPKDVTIDMMRQLELNFKGQYKY
ncbi:hypothetical protein H5410_052405 [Solanum commersonii]|uniref:Uncharacterized protein n=1 Tax=Solanum commersonii TaxID=4109 RepID=A0A9J5X1D1_SOLCO|nr:hypothetical protein H5410_052405 [Solanum commersonii]